MQEILGKAKTVRELLKGVKYSIDYYQREFKWQEKQIQELIEDLTGKFLDNYQEEHNRQQVSEYGKYFLGSIIISNKNNKKFIVDGQQRLTSLTLLLICLNNLQKNRDDKENVDELIFSKRFGTQSFNIEVEERTPCMKALFDGEEYDPTDKSESIQNIVSRYHDLEEKLPDEIRDNALPYFIDWLTENVHLIEITAYSDDDAYTIFETMNDRGLSLTPTDMLKGYLLANIDDVSKRNEASDIWKENIRNFEENGREAESDFFKAWLRGQYATKIRERKKNAVPEDFDRIATEYHRWLRDASENIGLSKSDDFYHFITKNYRFYSRHYISFLEASIQPKTDLEYILYNAHQGFSQQYMLLLAPLKLSDSDEEVRKKAKIVSQYLDILLTWRLWNFRSISYSTMQYAMFLAMREIRGLETPELIKKLHRKLLEEKEVFSTNDRFALHQQNRRNLKRILARITDFVEQSSGQQSRYLEYMTENRKKRYDIEHIWADKFGRHRDEFSHPNDFQDYRNHIGDLLLLPRSFNESYGDLPYEKKLEHYNSQNLLARSLHPQCYKRNPGFIKFINDKKLLFNPHKEFKKKDLDERGELYREIANIIWNPDNLLDNKE